MSSLLPTVGGIPWNYCVDPDSLKKYACGKCKKMSVDAMELSCPQHLEDEDYEPISYCKTCIEAHFASNDNKCPYSGHSNATATPANFIRAAVRKAQMYCPRALKNTGDEESKDELPFSATPLPPSLAHDSLSPARHPLKFVCCHP